MSHPAEVERYGGTRRHRFGKKATYAPYLLHQIVYGMILLDNIKKTMNLESTNSWQGKLHLDTAADLYDKYGIINSKVNTLVLVVGF